MVDRYEPAAEVFQNQIMTTMEEHPNGDYVSFEDYEELENRLADKENQLEILIDSIRELYRLT